LKLHPGTHPGRNLFTAYGADYVEVGGQRYGHSIVVTAERIYSDWLPAGWGALDESHFAYFLPLRPEVLLFGTGAQQRFPPPRLCRALIEANAGLEFMTTPAACRTYNVLLGEGRRVVAAILL
jgi:uncharacterized protein